VPTRVASEAGYITSHLELYLHFDDHDSPSILAIMADDASYQAFLTKANKASSDPSTSSTASSSQTDDVPKHKLIPSLNEKLANLSTNTFVTETDSDFIATFIPASALRSWSPSSNEFPAVEDLQLEVSGGREGETYTVEEWDKRGQYTNVIRAIQEVAKSQESKVYSIQGHGGRFQVFILAKVDDGLLGVKAKGVAT
jgi:hypothetical protein